jgi:hypothetical protein
VHSDGVISPGDIKAGDSVDNNAIQTFISHNISSIPSNAIIIDVKDNLSKISRR